MTHEPPVLTMRYQFPNFETHKFLTIVIIDGIIMLHYYFQKYSVILDVHDYFLVAIGKYTIYMRMYIALKSNKLNYNTRVLGDQDGRPGS